MTIPLRLIRHTAERQYAELLNNQGIRYYYQPRVRLSYGFYHPDFYLIKADVYVEIVGTRQAFHQSKRKIKVFYREIGKDKLLVLNGDGTPYRSRSVIGEDIPPMKPTEIKKSRQFLGLTQEKLAHRLGVSFATVNRWENGVSVASSLAIQSIKRLVEERQK